MKKIIILNGAARKTGNTAKLIQAFTEGAKGVGNEVKEFYLFDMNIHDCKGCLGAGKDPKSPCTQKDDMEQIYAAFADCDVVVFASPVYFWTISATLKTVVDRLYAEVECLGYTKFARECALLMTAGGEDYSNALFWYNKFAPNLHWKNRGTVLGAKLTEEAKKLGASL